MRGKAFHKMVEKNPDLVWRGARPSREDQPHVPFVRVGNKRTGLTLQITVEAVKGMSSSDLSLVLEGDTDALANADGVTRIIATDIEFPYSWNPDTVLEVLTKKYEKPADKIAVDTDAFDKLLTAQEDQGDEPDGHELEEDGGCDGMGIRDGEEAEDESE
jgi:hypothetical protein